ncbi:G-protein coupled estrogen receptor 1 [Lissotriton helveticus]
MEVYTRGETSVLYNLSSSELNGSQLFNESTPFGLENSRSDVNKHYVISLILSCLYTILLFPVGIFGNMLILVVNIRFREKMTIPDLYFINLAVADLILVADSIIEVFNLNKKYYDITILCTFMSLFLQINMYSSVFFLTWMSFDRYIALAKVMKSNVFRTMQHARLNCGLIWMASISATLVPFTAVQVQHTGDVHFCFADVKEIQWLEITIGFIIPFVIIGLCYSLIVRVLVRAHKHQSLRPRRQKALRMIFVVVLVFFICWLPENVFISVGLLQQSDQTTYASNQSFRHHHPLMGHIVNLAAFSNSCLNPIIYSFLGETFRDKLRLYIKQKRRVVAFNYFCPIGEKSAISENVELSEIKYGN